MSFSLLTPVKTDCNQVVMAKRNFNMFPATRDPSIADFSRGQCDNQNI